MRTKLTTGVLFLLVGLAGCGKSEPSTKSALSTPSATVPDSMFLASAPAEARPLRDVKPNAKAGNAVVLTGRIGSGEDPFVKSRAIFTIVDLSLKYCGEESKDGCTTPWDYCCEPTETLAANSATVQIVDANGKPLKADLNGVHGLKPLAVVTVAGTVAEMDGKGLVVNANSLYVQP